MHESTFPGREVLRSVSLSIYNRFIGYKCKKIFIKCNKTIINVIGTLIKM